MTRPRCAPEWRHAKQVDELDDEQKSILFDVMKRSNLDPE
jgi:hypothetical protein